MSTFICLYDDDQANVRIRPDAIGYYKRHAAENGGCAMDLFTKTGDLIQSFWFSNAERRLRLEQLMEYEIEEAERKNDSQ